MSTVHAVQSSNPMTTELPTYLTPDSLVEYCDSRLSSLDLQMQSIFNQQQQNAATTECLDNLAGKLGDLPGPNSDSPPTVTMSTAQWEGVMGGDHQISIDALSPKTGTPSREFGLGVKTSLGTELEQDRQSLFDAKSYNSDGTYTVPASTLTNITQNLKTYTGNLNSDSQMQMITLQSMMSQQQTAVELSTNLLSSLNQTNQSIAANFKVG